MTKYFAALVMFLVAWPSFAADPNGYTAQYECRAGNPMCDVDITGIAALPCDQIVTASDTNWSKITGNPSSRVFCIGPGDHTGKGTLTLTFNGTSEIRKIIRYFSSGDNDNNPWNQSAANQAKMPKISMNGVNYWIVHRLTFDGITAPAINVGSSSASSNIIISRVLMQNLVGSPTSVVGALQIKSISSFVWLQNSVCRNFEFEVDLEIGCIYEENSHHLFMVNNESLNVSGADWQDQGGTSASARGSVVENNDFYITDAYRTDGAGNQQNDGPRMASKSTVSSKRGGSSTDPVKIIHNRIWGKRQSDHNVCCTSIGSGFAFLWSNNDAADTQHTEYQLVQNNIVIDSSGGVNVPRSGPRNNSAIGNIFYLVKNYDAAGRGVFSNTTGASDEYYLNTIIESDRHLLTNASTNDDFRCTVYINAGDKSGSLGAGSVFDYNVWYGTTVFTTETPGNNISNALNTRANSTTYSLNDIIRTTTTPPGDGTAGYFLYVVTTAGTSAASPPAYCTTPDCETTDGTMVVTAIRGPYSFKRKLRTVAAGEAVVIPYARVFSQAPEVSTPFCPATFADRTGIGIDDSKP